MLKNLMITILAYPIDEVDAFGVADQVFCDVQNFITTDSIVVRQAKMRKVEAV